VKLLQNPRARPWLVLLASLVISLAVWRWAEKVLVPAYTAKVLASGRPIGNNSDLYPRWLGTRELLLHGRDPYSQQVTREIQTGFYGRPLNPANPSDPTAQESFVYPLYVAFLLAPTARLPFPTVVAIFRPLLLASIVFSVPLWMYAIRLRAGWALPFSGALLALGSYPAIEEYHQQNLTALVVLLLAASAATAVRSWLVLGGFLLALATVKPDTTGLMIVWFLVWAFSRWTERKRLIFSFSATMAALLLAAEVVSPHWTRHFVAALREYPTYGTDPSILHVLLPSVLATAIAALLVVWLSIQCWRWRTAAAGSEEFGWALALVSAVTLTVIPKLAAYNQLLLVPALLMLMAQYKPAKAPLSRALSKGAFACQIWQWLAATALAACSLLISAKQLRPAAEVPMYTLLALSPLTLFAVLSSTSPRRVVPRPEHSDKLSHV
jgi:Glycosyltransferase family 87